MKWAIIIFLILMSFTSIAQTTAIPDPNFEQALINLGLDSGPIDGVVPTANINTVTSLYIDNKNISDLTGIEGFTALTSLACTDNLITNLDVSLNLNLNGLWCGNNLITNLKFNNNLTALFCFHNQLTSLNVSQNTLMTDLICFSNQLTSLNLSQNSALTQLDCDTNQLTCLNIKNGNNVNLIYFEALNNPNLTCIEVDNVAWSTSNWAYIDPQTSFSTNCGNPCAVSVKEQGFQNTFSIFPNPTSEKVTIDLGEINSKITATLTNTLGQVIFVQQFKLTNLIQLNINAPKGIYFLRLEANGEVITKKIIKE